ncbi:MAG: cobalt ECF transporter T component CbiQ [Planctomycetales bacterium]|jgi:cobalt/nickel transport system permease protein|nr:cobalt ECF transporter T component CbiQ [Planctomycetales bacterium]
MDDAVPGSRTVGVDVSSRSVCHRLPANVKLGLTLLAIVVAGVIPLHHWPAQGLLLTLIFIGLSLSGVTIRYLARRLGLFVPLLLVLGLSVPVSSGNHQAWSWTVALWMRCTVSFLAGLWLIHVLPFREFLAVLRRWRCPAVFVAMLGFMYRYLFILWDELKRLRNARDARDFGYVSFWRRWTMNAQLIGLLLLRAMERAERTHRAMLARGWAGSARSLDDAV